MQVKHLSEAKPYEAPNHRGYSSLRLFGLDAGGPKQFTVGLSHFLPGGGAGPEIVVGRECLGEAKQRIGQRIRLVHLPASADCVRPGCDLALAFKPRLLGGE